MQRIRTLRPISDLVSGKYLVSQIGEIDIGDLLGRSSVPADPQLIRQMVEGKTIMITGAGGWIGSEPCHLIVKWSPQRLVLLEANEFALYNIDRELSSSREGSAMVPLLGSVSAPDVVTRALRSTGVQVALHASAHRHVPLLEANALERIRNNILDAKVVVDAALAVGVASFVLISSDK